MQEESGSRAGQGGVEEKGEPDTDEFDMPSKLWDLAKVVTGFAIVQAVFLGYKAAEPDFQAAMRPPGALPLTVITAVAFYVFYFSTVRWCRGQLLRRVPRHTAEIRSVYRGQMIAIVGALGLSVLAIFAAAVTGRRSSGGATASSLPVAVAGAASAVEEATRVRGW